MGQSKCSQCCERGDFPRRMGCETLAGPNGYDCIIGDPCAGEPCAGAWPSDHASSSAGCQITALDYTPPPGPEVGRAAQVLLGTEMPRKPPADKVHGLPNMAVYTSSRYSTSRYPSCARPGEPVNQVFVMFSNDLEGFLPYTLVISEEHGLEFSSLTTSPDFAMNPVNIMKLSLVSYDDLMRDAFFVSHSKSVLARPQGGAATPPRPSTPPTPGAGGDASERERIRPPYYSVVQLSLRRPAAEGGHVVAFIAVQSEPLAEELVRSCNQLRKRRMLRQVTPPQDEEDGQSLPPSRGCLTPRSMGARTPPTGTTPVISAGVTPSRTPRQQCTPQL
eukprot:TRINITY_DN71229_c0_g1_i1.p1 TRINITY_DN71229_c0_g1~~TRINITY_DN71229_c0_g1_i1.p1  ORF type:complete len:369 (-),score=31.96 TRINITY_DN71229_c0_g1_i1:131-1129(-)